MNLDTTPTGWLVIGRKPGESLIVGTRTLTYEGRLATTGGEAVFTLVDPSGGWTTFNLAAGTERHLPGADCHIRWAPKSDGPRGSAIRMNIRAPRTVRILRKEIEARDRQAVTA